jgi:pimeloyl-ACP methyl ester carboxylesterase
MARSIGYRATRLCLMVTAFQQGHAQETAAPLQWSASALTSIAGESVAADTARLRVPEDVNLPGAALVTLPVLRLRSTSPRPGPPIIFLSGGPGNAGLTSARGEIFPFLLSLRSHADVIVYDQRGTGRSEPSLEVAGTVALPLDASLSSQAARARLITVAYDAVRAVRERGVSLAAYTTAASVEDIEQLRRALGVERVALWGHSYGSHLALAYLSRYGARVDRVVLGGVNGLDQRYRLPSDGDLFLSRVDSAVRSTPRVSRRLPDLLGSLRALLAQLDSAPAMVSVDGATVHVGGDELRTLIAVNSGDRAFVGALPLLVHELRAGRFDAVARQVRVALKVRPVGTAMTYAMHIASGASPARRARMQQESATAVLRNAINYPFNDTAFVAAWDVPMLPEEFRATVPSATPALLISGTLDGRTSLRDAESVRASFARSGHIIVDGASHMPYALSDSLRALVVAFFGGAPPHDAVLHVDPEWRTPDETRLVNQVVTAAKNGGADAGVRALRALVADSTQGVTAFVAGNAFFALRQGGLGREAIAVLEAGGALFPDNVFLLLRRAEAAEVRRERETALRWYRDALARDPLNLTARAAVARLQSQ